jgi:hypothetical protein
MTGLRAGTGFGLAAAGIALAAVVTLPYGSPLLGESGIFFWLSCALCRVPRAAGPWA